MSHQTVAGGSPPHLATIETDDHASEDGLTLGPPWQVLRPLVWWSAIASALLFAQYTRGTRTGLLDRPAGDRVFAGWVQFDGPEYLQIATQGYAQRQLVWFPAYPLLIRAVDAIVGDPVNAAVAISLVGGALAAVLFWRWLGDQGMRSATRTIAFLTMLLYPYGWFQYGVVYAEGVFLPAAVGAFVLASRRHPLAAAMAAGVATLARPSGFAVVAGLLVLSLERDGVLAPRSPDAGLLGRLQLPIELHLHRARWGTWSPLLGLSGLVAYGTYQWIAFGNPLAFMAEQRRYHSVGPPTLLKEQYFEAWSQGFDGRHLATTTGQAVILTAFVLLVPAVGMRFGWGYGVYVLGLALLPAYSVSTFMGVGRYLLPAFPVFALAGEWLAARRPVAVVWLACSGALLVVMAVGFSRSWYLT